MENNRSKITTKFKFNKQEVEFIKKYKSSVVVEKNYTNCLQNISLESYENEASLFIIYDLQISCLDYLTAFEIIENKLKAIKSKL